VAEDCILLWVRPRQCIPHRGHRASCGVALQFAEHVGYRPIEESWVLQEDWWAGRSPGPAEVVDLWFARPS
jgi:hypothetical protein